MDRNKIVIDKKSVDDYLELEKLKSEYKLLSHHLEEVQRGDVTRATAAFMSIYRKYSATIDSLIKDELKLLKLKIDMYELVEEDEDSDIGQHLYIDPPGGWKYGFPKRLPYPKPGDINKWLVENGYPQDEIDHSGVHFHCRYFTQ